MTTVAALFLIVGVVTWILVLVALWHLAGQLVESDKPARVYDVSYNAHPEFLKTRHNDE
jgi:hypothetical protein